MLIIPVINKMRTGTDKLSIILAHNQHLDLEVVIIRSSVEEW